MSTHNIGFYEDLTKIIFQLSSNKHLISSHIHVIFSCIYIVTSALSLCLAEPDMLSFEQKKYGTARND